MVNPGEITGVQSFNNSCAHLGATFGAAKHCAAKGGHAITRLAERCNGAVEALKGSGHSLS